MTDTYAALRRRIMHAESEAERWKVEAERLRQVYRQKEARVHEGQTHD